MKKVLHPALVTIIGLSVFAQLTAQVKKIPPRRIELPSPVLIQVPPPVNVHVVNGGVGEVTATWTNGADNYDKIVFYYANSPQPGPTQVTLPGYKTSYVYQHARPSHEAYIMLRAYRGEFSSKLTEPVSIFTLPDRPSLQFDEQTRDHVCIHLGDPFGNNSAYLIYRRQGESEGAFNQIARIDLPPNYDRGIWTYYCDHNVAQSEVYTYKVAIVNQVGTSETSNWIVVSFGPPKAAFWVPQTKAVPGGIELYFTEGATFMRTLNVDGCRIERRKETETSFIVIADIKIKIVPPLLTSGVIHYTDLSIAAGETYHYRLQLYSNLFGNAPYSLENIIQALQ